MDAAGGNSSTAAVDPAMMDPAFLMTIYPWPSGDPQITRTAITAFWVMVSISGTFLALRLYCRASHVRAIWWDDWALMAGWTFMITAVCLQTDIFKAGYLVTDFTTPHIGPRNLASDSCMKIALALTKTSFSLTVLRIAVGWPRYVVYACIVVVNLACAVHAIMVWRQNCGTVEPWTFTPCWDADSGVWMNMVGSVISAATDFILTFIPLQIIWGLQMKRIEKIGVGVAMSIGILTGVVSIVKGVESYNVVKTVGTAFSYRLYRLTIWIHAEPNAAIVAASIPVLRILFRDVARSYGDYGSSDKGGRYLKSTTKSTFHGTSTATATAAKNDDDSEASILNDNGVVNPQARIHKTQQVSVEYDDSGNQHQVPNKQAWQQAEDIEMANYRPAYRRN